VSPKLTHKQSAILQQCLADERANVISYGPSRGTALLVHGLEKRGLLACHCHYGAHQLRRTHAGRAAAAALATESVAAQGLSPS